MNGKKGEGIALPETGRMLLMLLALAAVLFLIIWKALPYFRKWMGYLP